MSSYFIEDVQIHAALREVAGRLGRSPRTAEYDRERLAIIAESDAAGAPRTLPSRTVMYSRYPTWDDALVAAGLQPLGGRGTGGGGKLNKGHKAPRVSEEMIFDALRGIRRARRSVQECCVPRVACRASEARPRSWRPPRPAVLRDDSAALWHLEAGCLGSASQPGRTRRGRTHRDPRGRLDRGGGVSVPPAIAAMLDALEPAAILELERALRLRLQPTQSKAEQRVELLGFLAELLAQPLTDSTRSTGRVSRRHYEQERPESAPQAQRLVELFGSWQRACRAANGLLPDGRWTGRANPWAQPVRGRPRAKPYTKDEVRAALRACALELGRRPTFTDYDRWREEKRKHGDRVEGHRTRRLPPQRTIYRLYPTGANRWRLALADAGITDRDLAQAAARRRTAALRPPEPSSRRSPRNRTPRAAGARTHASAQRRRDQDPTRRARDSRAQPSRRARSRTRPLPTTDLE